jgi:hypothetical protein
MVEEPIGHGERSRSVSVTKADLIIIIADKLKFPWARAEMLLDVAFDCMEQSMSRGEKIELRATYRNYPYSQAVVEVDLNQSAILMQKYLTSLGTGSLALSRRYTFRTMKRHAKSRNSDFRHCH